MINLEDRTEEAKKAYNCKNKSKNNQNFFDNF